MQRLDANGAAIDMSKTFVYKLEVPANRYDLLCLEGIATALRCYLSKGVMPEYKLKQIADNQMQKVIVKPETKNVRQYVVGAILRNISFNEQSYNSFIDL